MPLWAGIRTKTKWAHGPGVKVLGDDIYGDGVNIAARLQTVAQPGGICISGTAFDHAVHKADVGFSDLGEQHLKNIADPVRISRVLLDPPEAGKVLTAGRRPGRRAIVFAAGVAALLIGTFAIVFAWQWPFAPQRTSIAVLPFANLSGDSAEDYYAMFRVLVLVLALIAYPLRVTAAPPDVDLELVRAVDTSGSMDMGEARVQRLGYLEALRHPDFINAVKGGYLGRIAIGYFEWAGRVNESSVVAWQVIEDAKDGEAFAAKLEARPIGTRHGTSISSAIRFGTKLIESNANFRVRRILDLSGDGHNNTGLPSAHARDDALARGIVINGLVILIRPSNSTGPLDQYYAECVIGGPGSFMIPVRKAEDFASAVRQKLLLEVSGLTPGWTPQPAAVTPPVDCLIGEKYPNLHEPVFPGNR